MNVNFSPFARRLIALALLFVVVVTALNVVLVPGITWVGDALGSLNDARFRRGHLAAEAAQPQLPSGDRITPDCCLTGQTRIVAEAGLRGVINGASASTTVTVERMAPVAAVKSDTIAVAIVAVAPDAAMMAFIDRLEHGAPVVRLTRWQLAAVDVPHGAVRLDAQITAVWRPRP